jgi:hypothetical protein
VHSLINVRYANAIAAERGQRPARGSRERVDGRPPPLRRGAASLSARVARRMDAETARRVVA